MGRKYGDIISFTVPGQTVVVINSLKVARELLEKRGQVWSDRPYVPLVHLMEMDEWALSIRPHNEAHRIERRIADGLLRPSSIAQPAYRSAQRKCIAELLKALLDRPEGFVKHIDFMLSGMIISLTYGYDLQSLDDKFVGISKEIVDSNIRSTLPNASIINVFPFFRFFPTWLPGMGRARDMEYVKGLGRVVREEPFARVIHEMRNGIAKPSFMQDYLLSRAKNGDPESVSESDTGHIVNVSAILYTAAVDTTGSLLLSFILLLVLYPEIQRRAQAEIDSVVGRGRLPVLDDFASLPYVQAVCLELQRWQPVSPMGVPHATSADDVYEGYFVPKGSMILANA